MLLLRLTVNYLKYISIEPREGEESGKLYKSVPIKLISLLEDIAENNPTKERFKMKIKGFHLICVDYNLIKDNIEYLEEQFKIYNIIGAIHFIYHSDIEGDYSVKQVSEIVD